MLHHPPLGYLNLNHHRHHLQYSNLGTNERQTGKHCYVEEEEVLWWFGSSGDTVLGKVPQRKNMSIARSSTQNKFLSLFISVVDPSVVCCCCSVGVSASHSSSNNNNNSAIIYLAIDKQSKSNFESKSREPPIQIGLIIW